MGQTLVIVRGAPASGKTTICEKLRDHHLKVAWLSVDKVKIFFSDFDDKDVDISYKTSLLVLEDLLQLGYSVVFDGIFARPEQLEYLNQTINIAKEKNIPIKIYQLVCSLATTLKRHRDRELMRDKNAIVEQETTKRLHEKVLNTPIEGAIELNTEEQSLEICIETIKKNFLN